MSRVIVCGAGPAGVTIAHTLAARGVETVLVERHTDLSREFRGEWLTPGGQRALREMGFGDLLERLPSVRQPRTRVHVGTRYRFSMRGRTEGEEGAILIPQPLLLGSIIERARRLPTFTYLDGTVVRELLRAGDRIRGVEIERAHGTVEQLEADLVLGTDGRTSVVRRRLGYAPPPGTGDEGYDVVWFNLPGPEPGTFDHEGHLFLVPNGTLFFHPYPGGLLQFGFVVDKKSFGALRRARGDQWYEEVAERLPEPFAAHVRRHAPDARPALLDVVCYQLDRWDAPGALLLGDAAHPMSPVGGQGINLALRDVIVALNLITPALAANAAPLEIDAAAAALRGLRAPEVARIQQLQRRGSDILHQRTAAARFMVQRVVPVVSKVGGPLLERGIGTTKEFSQGVTTVHLEPVAGATVTVPITHHDPAQEGP